MIAGIAMAWSAAKVWLERGTGIAPDALHAFAGVLLFAAIHLLVRPASLRMAWLGVFIAECLNEALDMARPAGAESDWRSSLHDLLITMFLPTILLVLWPALTRAAARQAPDDAASKESALP
ncbi:hypothetical protein ACLIMP_18800 [Novosphingobium aerophilum]|uniref:hypothetical protein n=1 Tax=Novosphingobium TaxID=165696 RepID=UPI0006C86B75|nr:MULTISPECIES: hypothetical protein [unclassified Novosphingobium]KPH66574.1 hypothetical protein ADT71_05215 [Novosphingobium sp. ST904]MPS68111.1 hypothetical protein [Novosphingobium sp.]TCM41538.1 hypothetical protein EDF59_103290 [Novosphingobium sp. ST904]WRT95315.1 hypothetical protein U9J33_24375 [Novosphingobium sp. RL4]